MQVPFFITRSRQYDPIVAVRFIVLFNAVTLGFQSVSGIGRNQSVDFISEGGRNDYPIRIPKPQTEPHRLTFKRGYQMRKPLLLSLLRSKRVAQRSGSPYMASIRSSRQFIPLFPRGSWSGRSAIWTPPARNL